MAPTTAASGPWANPRTRQIDGPRSRDVFDDACPGTKDPACESQVLVGPPRGGVSERTVLDKPAIDQIGLTEKCDFILKFTPEPGQMNGVGGAPPRPADDLDAPLDLFTAVQQQLGLKLESTKAPVEVLVIDHVEKPSAN